MKREKIKEIICASLDEVNTMLPPERQLAKNSHTNITNDFLDSLSMINFIVTIEQLLLDEYGVHVNLSDQSTFNSDFNPFETIDILTEYIFQRLTSEG
jgi:acyl carrier protein